MTPPTWLDAQGRSRPMLACWTWRMGWLAASIVAAATFAATTTQAQSIPAGTFDVTIAAGGGGSLPKDNLHLETVASVHLLPHVGYFLTNEIGDGPCAGTLRSSRSPH